MERKDLNPEQEKFIDELFEKKLKQLCEENKLEYESIVNQKAKYEVIKEWFKIGFLEYEDNKLMFLNKQ